MIKHKYIVDGDNVTITLSKTFKSGNKGVIAAGTLSIKKYKDYLDVKERQEMIGWFLNDNNIVIGVSNPLTSLVNSLKRNIEKAELEHERENNPAN